LPKDRQKKSRECELFEFIEFFPELGVYLGNSGKAGRECWSTEDTGAVAPRHILHSGGLEHRVERLHEDKGSSYACIPRYH
jgi:hypothetical protein